MIRLLASGFVAVFFVTVATLIIRPDTSMAVRVRPYALHSRARLGLPVDVDEALASSRYSGRSLVEFVTAPFMAAARTVLARFIDVVDDDDELSLRLRQAGIGDGDPLSYRRWQTVTGVIAALMGAVLMWAIGGTGSGSMVVWIIVGAGLGFTIGAIVYRNRLAARATQRAATLKIEAYSLATLLSVALKDGTGPVSALREIAALTDGEITKDLNRAMAWLARSSSAREVFDRVAAESPDPAITRIFGLLSTSIDSGMNPSDGMRDLANELRRLRREELEQRATRRRSLMLIPIMCLMLPVVALYALAPAVTLLADL